MKNRLIVYPEFDARIARDYMYSVCVTQGEKTVSLPVYNHTEDSPVCRNPIDDERSDEYRRFSTFAFEGDHVRVDIRVNRDFSDYAVIPTAKRFKHEFHDGVISVFLDHPDYFAVRLDGKDHTILAVFADEPESEIPTEGENTYIINGWHEVEGGIWKITKPNTTIYVAPGAILNARVHFFADNCKLIGRGAIVDPVGDIYRYDAEELSGEGGVLFVMGASNTLIDGIHMLDSKAFNIYFRGIWKERWADGNHVRNVKILSTQMSSDGIAFGYYSRNSYAEHCFIHGADNALVYEEYGHYRDITIGTTCNAIYPQTDVIDSLVEDIYIFRADEGIINPSMGGEDGITRVENHTIKNLYATDITFTPYFLFMEFPSSHPIVTARGGFTIENIWLPWLKDTQTGTFCSTMSSGDCTVTMRNVSVNGKVVREVTPETVGAEVGHGGLVLKYSVQEPFDADIVLDRRRIDYRNEINVFVGRYPIYFQYPIIREGNTVLLPADQLCFELRAGHMTEIVLHGGINYVPVDKLVDGGMAEKVTVKENVVVITPNEYSGNLFLEDRGIISKYTEYTCYACHLVTRKEENDTVYRLINVINHCYVGMCRSLREEIQKYGEGRYRISFEARSTKPNAIKLIVDYNACPAEEKLLEVDTAWKECSMDVTVGEAQIRAARAEMIIRGNGEVAVDVFDVKNIRLVKLK